MRHGAPRIMSVCKEEAVARRASCARAPTPLPELRMSPPEGGVVTTEEMRTLQRREEREMPRMRERAAPSS